MGVNYLTLEDGEKYAAPQCVGMHTRQKNGITIQNCIALRLEALRFRLLLGRSLFHLADSASGNRAGSASKIGVPSGIG